MRKREDKREGFMARLPYVGPGWYGKPAVAYILDAGLARWADCEWSLQATAHVAPDCLARALEVMEGGWPEGEEHFAKLSVNALIGLWARSKDVFYSMRTSSHEADAWGSQFLQVFFDAAGACHSDHVYATELFTNRSMRPAHDFVMASEYVAMARINRALREVPPRYLVALKTDCLVCQGLPKKFLPAVEALTRHRHRDGTPKYRFEEVKRLEGDYREPRLETEPPPPQEVWRHVEDPVAHCLDGGSLLLSGMPGTGKTHLARGRRWRTTGCGAPCARAAASWTGSWWRRSRSSTWGCGPTSLSSPRTVGCASCCSRYNTAERIEDLSLRSIILEASVPKLHQSAVSGLTGTSLQPILRAENLLVIGIATGCSSEAAELWSSTLLHSTTPQPQNYILLRFRLRANFLPSKSAAAMFL